MRLQKLNLLAIILIFFLAACNVPARPSSNPAGNQPQVGTIVAMTLTALRTREPAFLLPGAITHTPGPAQTSAPTLKATSALTATKSLTSTITPTYSSPLLVFDGNTNCREGPSTAYRIVTVLRAGQKITPVGVQGNYWVVNIPGGSGTCWVATDYATPAGSVGLLPTMTTPPPPTSAPPAAPTWSKWHYYCAYAAGGSTMTMDLAWTNLASNATGIKVYRDGQVVATLGPDSTSYTDTFFLASGKTASYYIEAYGDTGQADTSTIKVSCQ